jgi:hypothetical protein
METHPQEAEVGGIRERLEQSGLLLYVLPVQNAPEAWHALVIPRDQPVGRGTPFTGTTAGRAAEAALAHYRRVGLVD